MVLEIGTISLIVGVTKIVADILASVLNERIRRNKEARKSSSNILVYSAIIVNGASLNGDKVLQLLDDHGQPDGRNQRKR